MRDPLNDAAADLASAAGIGVVAGLRSMTAPAVVALAMNQRRLVPPSGKLGLLKGNKVAAIIATMAVGELIVDKLPGVPDRTSAPSLIVRIATGAFAAALLSASRERSVWTGAVAGGLGAIAGSFLGFNARKGIVENTRAKDSLVAVAEDAIAVGGGLLLVA
jgi:uncharacterized membrane protein